MPRSLLLFEHRRNHMARPAPLGKRVNDDRLVLPHGGVKVGFAGMVSGGHEASQKITGTHLLSSWMAWAAVVAWNGRGRINVRVAATGDSTVGRARRNERWRAREADMAVWRSGGIACSVTSELGQVLGFLDSWTPEEPRERRQGAEYGAFPFCHSGAVPCSPGLPPLCHASTDVNWKKHLRWSTEYLSPYAYSLVRRKHTEYSIRYITRPRAHPGPLHILRTAYTLPTYPYKEILLHRFCFLQI